MALDLPSSLRPDNESQQIQSHFCQHPPNSSISNPKSIAGLLSADKDVWLMDRAGLVRERHFDFEMLIQAYLYSCAWPAAPDGS